jgi:lipoyl(octanoyl) transferase
MQVSSLGRATYPPTYQAMQDFTASREASTPDELWICEHPAVFTQGLAGKAEHVIDAGDIPIVQTNRGGQVTYHGPGQVVAYPMMDLKRAGYFVKEYVYRIEEAVIRTLMHFGVTGHRVRGAPGIYVRLDDPFSHARSSEIDVPGFGIGVRARSTEPDTGVSDSGNRDLTPIPNPVPPTPISPTLGKIAALGIKVSRHCTYHGVALNVAMDLEPFSRINPCGYVGLQTVDLSTIGVSVTWQEAADVLSAKLTTYLAP